MTIKTATGITQFKEDKGYGDWFNQLYPVVKSRDSCQSELAREPSAADDLQQGTEEFIPVKSTSRKRKIRDEFAEFYER